MGMAREEFGILVKGMKAIYAQPGFIADQDAFDVWYEFFKDYPYKAVSMAVKAYMLSNKFPPTPAEINDQLQRLKKGNADSLPNAEEAWAMVRKAVRNSGYHAKEEFEKLLPIIQKAVGTPETLSAWGMTEQDQFETVQKSHFVKVYNTLISRERNEEKLPENIRKVISAARGDSKNIVGITTAEETQ